MKPVITLADVLQAAGNTAAAQVVTMTHRNALGVETMIRVRLAYGTTGQIAMVCPNCGENCIGLHDHPAGRGVICGACLRRQKAAS